MGPKSAQQDAAGNIINDPSADELLPLVPQELLLPRRPFPVSGPKWYTVPNPAAPKRDAEAPPLTQPGSKVPRADGPVVCAGRPGFVAP